MTDKYVVVEVLVRDENGERVLRWWIRDGYLSDIVEHVENMPNAVDGKFTVLTGVGVWDADE